MAAPAALVFRHTGCRTEPGLQAPWQILVKDAQAAVPATDKWITRQEAAIGQRQRLL